MTLTPVAPVTDPTLDELAELYLQTKYHNALYQKLRRELRRRLELAGVRVGSTWRTALHEFEAHPCSGGGVHIEPWTSITYHVRRIT